MTADELTAALTAAYADESFAMAQGDGLAEDAAAARIAALVALRDASSVEVAEACIVRDPDAWAAVAKAGR